MPFTNSRVPAAALWTLIVLQLIMLTALYAKVPPHPPLSTPLFGLAPFLGMALAVAAAALCMGPSETLVGRSLTLIAAVLAAVSFGPQKYFDAQFALIWPAVITGQIAILVLIANTFRDAVESPRTTAIL
ncbi:hypothetical protein [Shimia sp.]|uniref:hypothetical protein n=1 Tax=Shimia sp. TaxID=1954381 RepID=UPI003296C4D1